jgi:hypothetical protein
MYAAGQNPVKALCIKFTPTNTVSQTNPLCTVNVSKTEIKTMLPANTRIAFSNVMLSSLPLKLVNMVKIIDV